MVHGAGTITRRLEGRATTVSATVHLVGPVWLLDLVGPVWLLDLVGQALRAYAPPFRAYAPLFPAFLRVFHGN